MVPLVMERRTAGWYMHNLYYVKKKKKEKRINNKPLFSRICGYFNFN